jgi:hypothetical protein
LKFGDGNVLEDTGNVESSCNVFQEGGDSVRFRILLFIVFFLSKKKRASISKTLKCCFRPHGRRWTEIGVWSYMGRGKTEKRRKGGKEKRRKGEKENKKNTGRADLTPSPSPWQGEGGRAENNPPRPRRTTLLSLFIKGELGKSKLRWS